MENRKFLEANDFGRYDSLERVAGIDNQLRLLGDFAVVESRVVRHHHRAVGRCRQARVLRFQVLAIEFEHRHMRIGERQSRAPALEQQHDIDRGRFTHILNIFFVRHPHSKKYFSDSKRRLIVGGLKPVSTKCCLY